jgi:hypothetical protein
MQVALGADAKILVKERSPPGVIVSYVFIQLLVGLSECNERDRVKERGDVCECFLG